MQPLLCADGHSWSGGLYLRVSNQKADYKSSKALGFKSYWERSVCWPRWALIQATDPTECLPCVRRWLIR